jgi:hypothetical protein
MVGNLWLHPVGDVMHIAALHFVFNRIIDVEALDFDWEPLRHRDARVCLYLACSVPLCLRGETG